MISVVVDTNVLAASLMKKSGSNRRALRKIIDPRFPFQLVYSSQIADEYVDVLSRPFIASKGLMEEGEGLFRLVLEVGQQIVPKFIPAIVYPDEKDRPFLEAAVYSNAILLTNNLKDFPFIGVTVIAPKEFLAWCSEVNL